MPENQSHCAECGALVETHKAVIKQFYAHRCVVIKHFCSHLCHHRHYIKRLNQEGL